MDQVAWNKVNYPVFLDKEEEVERTGSGRDAIIGAVKAPAAASSAAATAVLQRLECVDGQSRTLMTLLVGRWNRVRPLVHHHGNAAIVVHHVVVVVTDSSPIKLPSFLLIKNKLNC